MLLATGVLPGLLALALMVSLLAAVPTAEGLARRFALNGALLLGWVPALWWVHWPVPVDHAAVAAAVTVAGLTWHVASTDRPRVALRGLVPELHRTDLLLPVSALLALASMWRWAFPGSARQALQIMLPGVDNAAHFTMYASILQHGATSASLGNAPDGSALGLQRLPAGLSQPSGHAHGGDLPTAAHGARHTDRLHPGRGAGRHAWAHRADGSRRLAARSRRPVLGRPGRSH